MSDSIFAKQISATPKGNAQRDRETERQRLKRVKRAYLIFWVNYSPPVCDLDKAM